MAFSKLMAQELGSAVAVGQPHQSNECDKLEL